MYFTLNKSIMEECLDDRIFNYEMIKMCSEFLMTRNAISISSIIKNRIDIIKSILNELSNSYENNLDILTFCKLLVEAVNTRIDWNEAKMKLETIIELCDEIKSILESSKHLFSKPLSLLYNCTMYSIMYCQLSILKILKD